MLWLGCIDHPDAPTMWVRKDGNSYLWCNGHRGPIAVQRDSDDLSVPALQAARRVVEHWEDIVWDKPAMKDWDMNEDVDVLKAALAVHSESGGTCTPFPPSPTPNGPECTA